MLNHQHILAALRKPFAPRLAAGLSMVELMVSVAVGSIVVIAGAENIMAGLKAQEWADRKLQVAEAASQIQAQVDCDTTIQKAVSTDSTLSTCFAAASGTRTPIALYSKKISANNGVIIPKSSGPTDFRRIGNVAIRAFCEACSSCPSGYGIFLRYMMMQGTNSTTPKKDPLTGRVLDINTNSDWANINGAVPMACELMTTVGHPGDPMSVPDTNPDGSGVVSNGVSSGSAGLDACSTHNAAAGVPVLGICGGVITAAYLDPGYGIMANGSCGCWKDTNANRIRYAECWVQNLPCGPNPPNP